MITIYLIAAVSIFALFDYFVHSIKDFIASLKGEQVK